MRSHPLTNFEIQKYDRNEPNFTCVYSRDVLPKIKDGAYIINLDEFKLKETHWITLYVEGDGKSVSYNATYFDSVGAEHSPKEIKKFIGNKIKYYIFLLVIYMIIYNLLY